MQEIVLAAALLGLLIIFHELGHFLAGRRAGVLIHEFAVGFGPALISIKKGETRYSLRLIPIGGFVRFAGEVGSQDDQDEDVPRERLLMSQSPAKRAGILVAGPATNLLVASLAFFLVFSLTGIQQPTPTVSEVLAGYPSEAAGIQKGDRIVAVEERRIETWQDLVDAVSPRAGLPTKVTVERSGKTLTFTVTPAVSAGNGVIGVRPTIIRTRLGILAGLYHGLRETAAVSVIWARGIIEMFAGKAPAEVTGPIGMTKILGDAARMGASELLYLLGALSANLGLINLLPIPAMDGSRLLFAGIEALRGKPIDPEKEGLVHFVGFFLLMALFAVITYRDIVRLVR